MQISVSQIVKEALEIPGEGFIRLVEEANHLLEMENGKVGNFNVVGRLAKIKSSGESLVVGDLHGDLESLIQILQESNFLQKMGQNADSVMIFLGDYGDRGEYSAEVYYTVLKLKLLYPTQIVLMRGNHEGPKDLMPSPHDLPMQFQARFGEEYTKAYGKIRELFEHLYNVILVKERYLMVHGGLPQRANTIEDLAYAHLSYPKRTFLEDMLWSDPGEGAEEVYASPRGAGKIFGINITTEALKKFGVKILIRGHEPCEEGFKIDHDGKVLTLFSRKGPPYFNAHGAYLNVRLSEKLDNAEQLVPFIHKF